MEKLDKLVVTVSQHTVFLAEAAIRQCSSCSQSPGIPFAKVLENVGNHAPGEAEYMLPVLGRCPNCQAQIDEETIVIPKLHRWR